MAASGKASDANSAITSSQQISPRAQACIEWLRDYAGSKVNSRLIDERRSIPPHIVLDFGNQGLLAMQVPIALGGKLELSLYDSLKVQRQMAAIDLTLAFFSGVNNILGVRPIFKFANPTIQERYLPDLASGRILAAFALTEADAGSNPLAIRATARANGSGDFTLNGVKVWSGSAAWSGLINVFTNLISADGKASGHAAFCVPTDLEGVRQGPEALTAGLRGMVQNSFHLEGAHIGSGYMLGPPGAGLAVANDSMVYGRLGIAATCVGGMWRALQLAGRYARRRIVGSAKLIESDLLEARMASMYAAARAADSLVDRLARDIDDGVCVPTEAYSSAKALCSEWLGKVVDVATQTLGGRGYIETNLLPQMARDARITRLFEGPTDTLLMHVGRRLLNESSHLPDYIKGRLGATQIATALRAHVDCARELLKVRTSKSQTVVHTALGQLAALHLVEACTHEPLCTAWLEIQIVRAESELLSIPLACERVEEMLEGIADLIGDIEQAAPDEERSLDPYLRNEFSMNSGKSARPCELQ